MCDKLKQLIEKCKSQGYCVYSEFRKCLPSDILDDDQIEDITSMFEDMGIEIRKEKAEVVDINSIK